MEYSEQQIENLIKSIYDGTISPKNLPRGLYKAIGEYFEKGVIKGFGKISQEIEYEAQDLEMLEALRVNTWIFSGAKTFQETREMSALIYDEAGKTVPFKDFKRLALDKYEKYNVNYLETEYNFAIKQSRAASQWMDIERNKEVLPLLQFETVGDSNVRDEHKKLDGIIRKVSDPFWIAHMPPLGWNCFPAGTKVLTPQGYKDIDKIKLGDKVIGGSGKAQDVDFIHVNNFTGELVGLVSKKDTVYSTPNHRYLTFEGWRRAENIKTSDILIQRIEPGFFNHMVTYINNMYALLFYILVSFKRSRFLAFTDHSIREPLFYVKDAEGFTDGAPLNGFNSLKSFKIISFFRHKWQLVKDKKTRAFTGEVFNLSVREDSSYITNIAIVHNCRCIVKQLDEGEETNLEERGELPKVPELFAFNPGIDKEVFNKTHPYFDIPKEYKKAARNNFGLEIPEIGE